MKALAAIFIGVLFAIGAAAVMFVVFSLFALAGCVIRSAGEQEGHDARPGIEDID